jgi:hypothetical protein
MLPYMHTRSTQHSASFKPACSKVRPVGKDSNTAELLQALLRETLHKPRVSQGSGLACRVSCTHSQSSPATQLPLACSRRIGLSPIKLCWPPPPLAWPCRTPPNSHHQTITHSINAIDPAPHRCGERGYITITQVNTSELLSCVSECGRPDGTPTSTYIRHADTPNWLQLRQVQQTPEGLATLAEPGMHACCTLQLDPPRSDEPNHHAQ